MSESEAVQRAEQRLIAAIRRHARFAADFEATANNYDRPIAETPWLAEHRYGDGDYDARWYALMSALTHFNEGLIGAIADELAVLRAVVAVEGAES